jgi:hypothetical protein
MLSLSVIFFIFRFRPVTLLLCSLHPLASFLFIPIQLAALDAVLIEITFKIASLSLCSLLLLLCSAHKKPGAEIYGGA